MDIDHQQIGNAFVINSGLLPKMLWIVQTNDVLQPELLYEASVCLSCISAGSEDETLIIQEADLIPFIYQIFDTKYDEQWDYRIKGQIGLIIGNIAGNSNESRDFILEEFDGLTQIFSRLVAYEKDIREMNHAIKLKLEYILQVKNEKANPSGKTKKVENESLNDEFDAAPPMKNEDIVNDEVSPPSADFSDPSDKIALPYDMELEKHKLSYVRTLLWTISNFYRWSPRPTFHEDNENRFLTRIATFWNLNDFEIQRDVAWLFSYITDISDGNMDLVISNQNALNKIRSYLTIKLDMTKSNYVDVLHPILRIYGNFASGSSKQTDVLIKHNFFDLSIKLLLEIAVPKIQQEICFITSNVLMGSPSQRRCVMLQEKLFPCIVSILLTSESDKVRKEAIWALGALLSEGVEQGDVNQLAENRFMEGSPAFQDNLRYFILKTIQATKSQDFFQTSKAMLKLFKLSLVL